MVKMAPKLTFGTFIADWKERINVERMNRERAEKAKNALRSHNVPALLVTKNGAELLDHWSREEILVAPPGLRQNRPANNQPALTHG